MTTCVRRVHIQWHQPAGWTLHISPDRRLSTLRHALCQRRQQPVLNRDSAACDAAGMFRDGFLRPSPSGRTNAWQWRDRRTSVCRRGFRHGWQPCHHRRARDCLFLRQSASRNHYSTTGLIALSSQHGAKSGATTTGSATALRPWWVCLGHMIWDDIYEGSASALPSLHGRQRPPASASVQHHGSGSTHGGTGRSQL